MAALAGGEDVPGGHGIHSGSSRPGLYVLWGHCSHMLDASCQIYPGPQSAVGKHSQSYIIIHSSRVVYGY